MYRFSLTRLAILAMVLAIPFAAFGDPVAKARGVGSTIDWQLSATGHDRVELRVITPSGELVTREFKGGQSPSLRVQDLGSQIEEGTYHYELRIYKSVPADVAKRLANARAANDEAAAKKILRDAGLTSLGHSGAFTIQNGAIVNTEATEVGAATGAVDSLVDGSPVAPRAGTGNQRPGKVGVNDQVIPDDLIVQASACVGFDCVNGESFGFDTIRLKENNTRIKFEDTSVGSFPTVDWQLTANDSASGGASKFSIEDVTGAKVPFTVTANAATNSIFVDSTGRVGFRTSTPVLDLHVSTSNTPALRLEQTSAGGFTAQTWDIAGNEANFFVRDVTGGSRLPFRIRPGAPTSTVDIAADGMVGIGTASPDNKLDVIIGTRSGTHNATDRPFYVTGELGQASNGAEVMHNNGTSGVGIGFGGIYTRGVGVANLNFSIMPQGTGNVGVNILTPTSKLHVNGGDIRITGGSFIDDGVTLTAPDYVFEESYKLMPLTELAEFIRENNHLPNVPSAKDIKANGLNMSHFQMRLLEKVEELTLYTLTQNEQIGTLKSQNEELQKRLTDLEGQLVTKQ